MYPVSKWTALSLQLVIGNQTHLIYPVTIVNASAYPVRLEQRRRHG